MSIAANKDSLEYVGWIKSDKECLICFAPNPDPDHLEAIGMGGNRKKPTLKHYTCIPLCRLHHSERHSIGNTEFEAKYKVNLWKEAFKLLREYHARRLENS